MDVLQISQKGTCKSRCGQGAREIPARYLRSEFAIQGRWLLVIESAIADSPHDSGNKPFCNAKYSHGEPRPDESFVNDLFSEPFAEARCLSPIGKGFDELF